MSPKAPTLPALRVDSQSFPKRLLLSPLRLPPPQPVLPSLHHGARAPAPPQGPTTGNQRPTSPPQRTPPLCLKPSAPRPHQPAPPRGPLPHSQPAAPGGGGGGCPRACATATLQGEGSRGGTCPHSHPSAPPHRPATDPTTTLVSPRPCRRPPGSPLTPPYQRAVARPHLRSPARPGPVAAAGAAPGAGPAPLPPTPTGRRAEPLRVGPGRQEGTGRAPGNRARNLRSGAQRVVPPGGVPAAAAAPRSGRGGTAQRGFGAAAPHASKINSGGCGRREPSTPTADPAARGHGGFPAACRRPCGLCAAGLVLPVLAVQEYRPAVVPRLLGL